MAFSTRSEVQTLVALDGALRQHGYHVSQKSRVLDVIEAVAALPEATKPAGCSSGRCLNLGEVLPGVLRANAGALNKGHPWLRSGDWDYAFKSHFDFVVHAPLGGPFPTHPLFAVEFDGPSHTSEEARERDCRKNRLCAASGLQLVRVDESFLLQQEQLVLVRWLADLWLAHRQEMPRLIEERDGLIASMTDDDWEEMGRVLWPDLDANLLFKMGHPYPPILDLAQRLQRRFGFNWSWITPRSKADGGLWQVGRYKPPMTDLFKGGLTERWEATVRLVGPGERTVNIAGQANIRSGYPLALGANHTVKEQYRAIQAGRLPHLPAGPWLGASSLLGEALCLYDTLRSIGAWLERDAAFRLTSVTGRSQ